MSVSRDRVVPHGNGVAFLKKPPLPAAEQKNGPPPVGRATRMQEASDLVQSTASPAALTGTMR